MGDKINGKAPLASISLGGRRNAGECFQFGAGKVQGGILESFRGQNGRLSGAGKYLRGGRFEIVGFSDGVKAWKCWRDCRLRSLMAWQSYKQRRWR
jgi:hypothetical protein